MVSIFRAGAAVVLAAALLPPLAHAQTAQPSASSSSTVTQAANPRSLAPGFTTRAATSKLVVIPVDMELFSISAGGVLEPKADWTDAAARNFRAALTARQELLGANVSFLKEEDLDDLAEVNALHGAVAQAVYLHHTIGAIKLPTKDDKLNWSMGDAVKPLQAKTGADYALFSWVRDSYASSERKAAMVALALVGIGIPAGAQLGYASLVDLRDGRVVWFNGMRRGSGDLREQKSAVETVETLFKGLPAAR